MTDLKPFTSYAEMEPRVEPTWVNMHIEAFRELEQYRSLGGIGLFQNLRLRQRPTECIKEERYKGCIDYRCPWCKKPIISKIGGEWCAGRHQKYCDNCGQHLDWEGE